MNIKVFVGAIANGGIQTSGNINTQVDHVSNKPVVNIAKPEGGISHNQYNQYNVTPSGAILNNSAQSQLQPQFLQQLIASNPNLTEGAASVILNEVISKNHSLLNGAQDVHNNFVWYHLGMTTFIASFLYPSDFKYRIESDASVLSSRKITQRNSRLLPSYLTMKLALWHAPKGRLSC